MTMTHRFAIYIAALWSGFFVMGVELLGARLLTPYYGSSVFVYGAVISVFMAALSAGYLLGGQFSLRSPSIGRLGGLLAAAALTSVPIIGMDDTVLEHLSYAVPDPRYGSLLGAAVLFGVPTVISGMVSPYAVRLLITDVHQSGRSAGVLYFVSTLGSAAGTIGTTFYAVLWFEVDTIILGYIGVSMAVSAALMALQLGARFANPPVEAKLPSDAWSAAAAYRRETKRLHPLRARG